MKRNACIVTVTYGQRWHLLSSLLDAALAFASVTRIIVVDNGSDDDLGAKISEYGTDRIERIRLERNYGSAKGFKLGLEAAMRHPDCEYVWMLDDDNVPEPDALEILWTHYAEFQNTVSRDKLALLSLRTDRIQYQQVAQGARLTHWFAQPNSFVGFHLSKVPSRLREKIFAARPQASSTMPTWIEVPYGPYGGLFFHASLVGSIGLPDERFYLYGDDSEFTHRILRQGGKLYLITRSKVADANQSWDQPSPERKTNFFNRMSFASDEQLYYGIRNGALISQQHYRQNAIAFWVNKHVYQYSISCYLLLKGQWSRLKLFRTAIADAEKGRLGQWNDPDAAPRSGRLRQS